MLRHALVALLLCSGCATIFTGTKDDILIESNPPGAQILMDGSTLGQTPHTITVKRTLGSRSKIVHLTKPGYEASTVTLKKRFNMVSILNLTNFLCWGVDLATGSLMLYDPTRYSIDLRPSQDETEDAQPRLVSAEVVTPMRLPPGEKKRLMFFDISIHSPEQKLVAKSGLFTRVMASALANQPSLIVMDQGTRDTLILQRKMSLEDCKKVECRFAIAKSLPGIELMLEADIEEVGTVCVTSVKIKSVKTGAIVSSQMKTTSCELREVLETVESASRAIWPPAHGR